MLRTLGNVAGNVASTVAGGVGRLVDVRPAYRQIGNYIVKGASYESFDSSGLFGSWGSSSGSSDSSGYFSGLSASSLTSGISGDSSGYFSSMQGLQGIGQIGNGLWGASGGTDASDGSGGGISSYLPSGQSAGIAFGISAVFALFPVALILNHMITMPLIMRICAAILVYAVCLVNPFMAIPIYLFYILRAAVRWNSGEKYWFFPFLGFWPLRVRKATDGSFITALTWMFSYLDPDTSNERNKIQQKEYIANAELYVASLVNTLRLSKEEIGKLGITPLAQRVFDRLMEPLTGPAQTEGVQTQQPSAQTTIPVANTATQKGEIGLANQTVSVNSVPSSSAVQSPSAEANTDAQKVQNAQKGDGGQANRNASVNSVPSAVASPNRNEGQANKSKPSVTPSAVAASAVAPFAVAAPNRNESQANKSKPSVTPTASAVPSASVNNTQQVTQAAQQPQPQSNTL